MSHLSLMYFPCFSNTKANRISYKITTCNVCCHCDDACVVSQCKFTRDYLMEMMKMLNVFIPLVGNYNVANTVTKCGGFWKEGWSRLLYSQFSLYFLFISLFFLINFSFDNNEYTHNRSIRYSQSPIEGVCTSNQCMYGYCLIFKRNMVKIKPVPNNVVVHFSLSSRFNHPRCISIYYEV